MIQNFEKVDGKQIAKMTLLLKKSTSEPNRTELAPRSSTSGANWPEGPLSEQHFLKNHKL